MRSTRSAWILYSGSHIYFFSDYLFLLLIVVAKKRQRGSNTATFYHSIVTTCANIFVSRLFYLQSPSYDKKGGCALYHDDGFQTDFLTSFDWYGGLTELVLIVLLPIKTGYRIRVSMIKYQYILDLLRTSSVIKSLLIWF